MNVGADKSGADLKNLEGVVPNLTGNRDDQTNVDLTFRKKIKVI